MNTDLTPVKELGSVYGARLIYREFRDWAEADQPSPIGVSTDLFDTFLVSRADDFSEAYRRLIDFIIAEGGSWVEVFGSRAEEIHDVIDSRSVGLGRQEKVGDGNPMTAWNERMDDAAIAAHILAGGLGEEQTKLVVVVGSSEVLSCLRERIGQKS